MAQGHHHIHLVVVDHKAEHVFGGEVLSDVHDAAQGFGQRFAAHAARAVNHQREALG